MTPFAVRETLGPRNLDRVASVRPLQFADHPTWLALGEPLATLGRQALEIIVRA